MEQTKKIFGRKLTYVSDIEVDDKHIAKLYHIGFKSIDSIHKFYEKCRENATSKNFGGNEYKNFSHIIIDNIVINPPKYFNGDYNWSSYKKCDKQRYFAEIYIH